MLDNTPNQPSKFRTKSWFEVNDDTRRTYNTNSKIKLKTSILKASLCNYSNPYVLVKGNISIAPQTRANLNNGDKELVFNNGAPFFDCISEINKAQIDNAKDIEVAMPMYNLMQYSDNYSSTAGIVCQYYTDEPFLGDNNVIANFLAANNNSASFKFQQKK